MSVELTDAAAAPAQTSLEKQTQALSSKEARELARSREPTCYCLTAKADRSLTSTLTKPEGLRCMLDPKSMFMQRWDNFIMMLLLFVAFVTPFEVAFLPTKPDALFVINRIVDTGFIVDMCFQFFLPYFDSSELVYVWNRDLIALNYCMGWFPIDVVSVLPYDFFGGDPFLQIDMPEVDDEASGSLRTLRLAQSRAADLAPLSALALTELDLSGVASVVDASPLAPVVSLQRLSLEGRTVLPWKNAPFYKACISKCAFL